MKELITMEVFTPEAGKDFTKVGKKERKKNRWHDCLAVADTIV